jgi:hypothetical protein
MYSLPLVFPRSTRGSLHITHTCTCIGLCPPMNDSCSFPTWYHSARLASLAGCNSVLDPCRRCSFRPPPLLIFLGSSSPCSSLLLDRLLLHISVWAVLGRSGLVLAVRRPPDPLVIGSFQLPAAGSPCSRPFSAAGQAALGRRCPICQAPARIWPPPPGIGRPCFDLTGHYLDLAGYVLVLAELKGNRRCMLSLCS